MPDEATPAPPSLSEKLDRLFQVVRPSGEDRQYTYKEVAAAISERGGPATTANYIYLLRSGRRDNPGKRLLEALADFFGTNVSYFYDTSTKSTELDEQMQMIARIRESPVHQMAMRTILDVSPGSLSHVLSILDQVKALERLPKGAPPPAEAWTGEEPGERAKGPDDSTG